jgi:hypothetical protein
MKPNRAWTVEASTLSSGASNGRHFFQQVRSEQCKIFLVFNHFSDLGLNLTLAGLLRIAWHSYKRHGILLGLEAS